MARKIIGIWAVVAGMVLMVWSSVRLYHVVQNSSEAGLEITPLVVFGIGALGGLVLTFFGIRRLRKGGQGN